MSFLKFLWMVDNWIILTQKNKGGFFFLLQYLDALYERRRELSKPYHSQLVALYADYDRKKLLPLLLTSGSYDLRDALQICRSRCLTTETIHLLGMLRSFILSVSCNHLS